ncbi:EboA domain-containing protein [Streptomyces sp. NPDC006385]|uniref:EboA domain-containing protein n=1 Tax=Streptomyces sp. NPDC006385 TaxID=3156761 RepID=UPI0033B5E630
MTHPRTTPATPGAETMGPATPATGDAPARAGTGREANADPPDAESRQVAPDAQGTALGRTPPAELRGRLTARLDAAARAWLHRALDEATDHPGTHGPISVWELRIAEAGRRCGPEYADAARVLILHAARADTDALTRVYFQGTAAERRAVLHALPHLVPGPQALPLVEDALRTNDTRLLAAAVGPYAARHLDAHQWRHAVLKCLFTGVSVDTVADLDRRAHRDAELARMLGDYAAERTAAGRPVPEDLHRVLTLTDPTATPPAPAAERGTRGTRGTDGTDGKES